MVLPGCETVGLKLRGTDTDGPVRLDVKARLGPETELRPAAGITGLAAAWSKWTLGLADRAAIVSGLEAATPTLVTRKRRLIRRYVLDDGRAREVPSAEAADTGCDVELATIIVEGLADTWWSLGFEAFGPSELVWDTLQAASLSWFERRGSPPLAPSHRLATDSSTAYPAWLLDRLTEAARLPARPTAERARSRSEEGVLLPSESPPRDGEPAGAPECRPAAPARYE